MGKNIIVSGAEFIYPTQFGTIIVIIPAKKLSGTGHATVNGSKVCHAGDEKQADVLSVRYTTSTATTPGDAKITITKAETASFVTSTSPVIIGEKWTVLCTPLTPAHIPGFAPTPVQPPASSADGSITNNPNLFVTAE